MLKRIIRLLFTWWNGQTLGTLFYTWKNGIFVGDDNFGNKYYINRNFEKRWVVYKNFSEGSKIDPDWHSWLRFTRKEVPERKGKKYNWQKPYRRQRRAIPCHREGEED